MHRSCLVYQVGQQDPPVFRLLIDMRLVAEAKSAILRLAEEALVILAFVFISDFTARLEKQRKEMHGVRRYRRGIGDEG